MKAPIIISENGDIYIYASLEKAESDIEPTDVENNIYVIYDSEGLLLFPVVINDSKYDVVKIYPSNEERPLELMEILVDFFSEVGHDSVVLKTMSLEDLISLGLKNYFKD